MLDDEHPGVRVVQQPASALFDSKVRTSRVHVDLDPDVEFMVHSRHVPWRVGKPDRNTLMQYDVALRTGIEQARERCAQMTTKRAMFRDRNGQQIVSVRLTDTCQHRPADRVQSKCGSKRWLTEKL